jgi:hypothetical protein
MCGLTTDGGERNVARASIVSGVCVQKASTGTKLGEHLC